MGSVTTTAAIVVTRTISHIADGASFRTTFILLNAGNVAANFTLDSWTETGGPLMLDLGADGVTAVLQGVIPPNGSRFIRTAGTTAALNKGWAELTANTDVDGNSIFGLQTPGQGDSEAAVPLSGITEGFHNKMELINRQAYGFRNFENYRLRVKVLCG